MKLGGSPYESLTSPDEIFALVPNDLDSGLKMFNPDFPTTDCKILARLDH